MCLDFYVIDCYWKLGDRPMSFITSLIALFVAIRSTKRIFITDNRNLQSRGFIISIDKDESIFFPETVTLVQQFGFNGLNK